MGYKARRWKATSFKRPEKQLLSKGLKSNYRKLLTYPLLGLSLPWFVDFSLAGDTEFKLFWLVALDGASCSRHGVEDRRLLNLGILENCGDDGASLGVVAREALAPRKKYRA